MNRAAQSLGRLGGKAGTGKAKRRKTSFSTASAKAALAARWAKSKFHAAKEAKNAARMAKICQFSHCVRPHDVLFFLCHAGTR